MDDTTNLPIVGVGAYGNVYSNGEHAIKDIMHVTDNDGPLLEIIIMKMDLHPNIVKLVSVSHGEGVIQLKMPYIPYTLNHMDSDQLDFMIDRIIDALAHLHAAGIMHRDVKPANILVDDGYDPFICDFSLSLIAEEGRSYVCSDGFRPPEVMVGSTYDRAIDVWALGATILSVINEDADGMPDDVQAVIDIVGATQDEVDRFMAKYDVDDLKPKESTITGDTRMHELARQMLRLNPEDRPTMQSLRQYDDMINVRSAISCLDGLNDELIEALTSDQMYDHLWQETINYM